MFARGRAASFVVITDRLRHRPATALAMLKAVQQRRRFHPLPQPSRQRHQQPHATHFRGSYRRSSSTRRARGDDSGHCTGVTVLHPPLPLAVAARVHDLPAERGRYAMQPKLDGYRCAGFGSLGLLQSRQGSTALTDRFPEVVADLAALGDVVVDGELVALRGGRLVFTALQFGPERRAREHVTAALIVFDLLGHEDRDLRGLPYVERRAALERLLARPLPHVQLIEETEDPQAAREWLGPAWGAAGVEGVVGRPLRSRYAPGTRSGWIKVRQTITVEVVVLGVVGADVLVLGQPDRAGRFRVRGLSHPVPAGLRAELAALLRPDDTRPGLVELPPSVGGLPGGPPISYVPVRPECVVEITADTAVDHGGIQRHRVTVVRVRPDLTTADLPIRG